MCRFSLHGMALAPGRHQRRAAEYDARVLRIGRPAMMHNQKGLIQMECDSCDEVLESDRGEEFNEFKTRAKRDGWHIRKIADVWLHGCPKCGAPT